MIDVKLIKNRINCVDYAQRIGIAIKKSGDRCISPLRAGAKNKTSFVIHDDFFYDFGSGESGDVIDFCAMYAHNGNRGEAIRELAKFTGVDCEDYDYSEWQHYTQSLCNKIAKWQTQLNDDDFDYLHKRGITDDTIAKLRLGRTDDGRLCIPYIKNGYVAYYATRDRSGLPDAKKYMKMPIDEYNEHIVWGLDTLSRTGDTLVIAEGAFDVMSFWQENYPCISAITGNFSAAQLPTVLSAARSFKQVFLVFDNDYTTHAGEKFTLKMSKILMNNNIKFIVGNTPKGIKDVSLYYQNGGSLQELIDSAVNGIEFLCEQITDEAEFDDLARKTVRFMKKPDIVKFFAAAKNSRHFDIEWLSALNKDCLQPPSEDYISKQVIKRHKMLYNPKIGFFEWNGKYWERRPDEVIQCYIGDELGVFRTGSKLSSVIRIVRADCVTERVFNTEPVVNFINGTLELEPNITFREHKPDDLCTYCLQYPYDDTANNVAWDEFIDTVTDSDEKKQALLQEACGYVLFADNRLQKCFVLMGTGANGKSVFLNTISKVFGKENISNVEMSAFGQDFQRIQIMSSLLNISSETKSDVTGAESYFKQAVAGDDMSACFKGKDYITFKPRAKLFLSCNEYVRSKDTTDGWLRRFLFIEFPLKFCEYPTLENERLMDKEIEKKLSSNLSGIFNWVLNGYKVLKSTMYFTETDDQSRILDEYRRSNSPVIDFICEYEFAAPTYSITNEDFYREYREWCDGAGHKAASRGSFLKRIAPLIKEYRPDIEKYRTTKVNGYKLKDGDVKNER